MRKFAYLSLISFSFIFTISCSSIDSDAKQAAELNKKSLNYIKEQNLEKAEKLYNESQEIIARYKGTEQYTEFQRIYSEYMLGENANN